MDPMDKQGGKKYGQLRARQEAYLDTVNRDILSDEDFQYVHVSSLAERLNIYKKKFMQFDQDNSGDIDFLEVKQMLEKLGVARTHLEAKKLIDDNDQSKRGAIGYRDFVNMLLGNVLGIGIIFDEEEDLEPKTVKKGILKQKRQAPEPPKSSTPFTALPRQHSFQDELKKVISRKITTRDENGQITSPDPATASVYRPPTPDSFPVPQPQPVTARTTNQEQVRPISTHSSENNRPITPVGFPEPSPPATPPPEASPPPYEPPTVPISMAPVHRGQTPSLPSPEVSTTSSPHQQMHHQHRFHHPQTNSHGTARVYAQNPTVQSQVAYPCTYACCAGATAGMSQPQQVHGIHNQMYVQKCTVPGCTQCHQGVHQMAAHPSTMQHMVGNMQHAMGMVQPIQGTVPQGYVMPTTTPYQTVSMMNLNGGSIPSGAVVYPSGYGHHALCPCPSCAKAKEIGAAGGAAYTSAPAQYMMANGGSQGYPATNGMAFQGSMAAQSRNGMDLGHGYKLYSGSAVEGQMAALNLR